MIEVKTNLDFGEITFKPSTKEEYEYLEKYFDYNKYCNTRKFALTNEKKRKDFENLINQDYIKNYRGIKMKKLVWYFCSRLIFMVSLIGFITNTINGG